MFNSSQRSIINHIVSVESAGFPVRFIEGLFDLLIQIGDESNLQVVSRVSRGRAVAGRQMRIEAAARRCEGALDATLKERMQANTLLRPSAVDSGLLLLRTAHDTKAESDLLLRPERHD